MPPATVEKVLDKITKVSADPQALQQTLTDSMPFLLNDLKPEARQQLGYEIQEMVNFCEYNQLKCDLRYTAMKDWSKHIMILIFLQRVWYSF